MNIRLVFKTLGKLLQVLSVLMCLPLIFSLIYFEIDMLFAFMVPIIFSLFVGTLLTFLKPKNNRMYAKEGCAVVGLSWILMSLFGCLPFVISGMIPNFFDAFFETVSGFTTTGSTIVRDIEAFYDGYKGLLFWRSFTHWIGGMGVLVFVLAVLPSSEGQNIFLIKAESTGAKVGKLVSKVRVTARILYIIYLVMTIICIVMLALDPSMGVYDAIVHGVGTAGTGGFGIRGLGIGYYSNYCQIVIAVFMMLFGINFNMFYLLLIGKVKDVFKNEELRWYLIIIIIATAVIGVDIYFDAKLAYDTVGGALKDSYFQVSAVITTTGYATTDFAYWSNFSRTILFILMFVGGCAGSTAGGLKVQRILILFKSGRRELKKIAHQKSVQNIKLEGKTVEDDVAKGVTSYFAIIMILFFAVLLLISFDGLDFESNVTTVATCINNIGPGLSHLVGPMGNFADYSGFSKVILSFTMLIGRLEIYPILLIFNPKVWTNK